VAANASENGIIAVLQFPARRIKFLPRLDKFPVLRNKIPCSDFKPAGMHGKE
jgi:hypothetical protein